MASHVFTYGSLMFPQVWERVVRGRYPAAPALVRAHGRYAISGETYPGMVPVAGASVQGVLYLGLDGADLAALDAFEGSDYRRQLVEATLDSGEVVMAETYIYLRVALLLDTPWHPEAFQMQRFLDTYCRSRLTG